jgi:flagellar biosynthetic protein FlhB
MAAPVVVAKGIDEIALRIQSVALEKGLPVARIPPLARYMYRKVRVGEAIPTQLFEAVAQVLAWAYDIKNNKPVDAPPPPNFDNLPVLAEEINRSVL